MTSCQIRNVWSVEIYETSAAGNKLSSVKEIYQTDADAVIEIQPELEYQKITGFGGAFTESSAYLLNKISEKNREKILKAYFSEKGAQYSLTRTTMGSCDFSLNHYTYAPISEDYTLDHFSVQEDLDDIIPMIKDAQLISKEGFKIIASPWTAPPWMKDNNAWIGGRLLPEFRNSYALYFSKYLSAYKKMGIDIWGVTVVNEPHGNGDNWESMLFTPKEMTDLVVNHLGPELEEHFPEVKILGYDQNRAELKHWVDEMYRDEKATKYFSGAAVHWYDSTYKIYEDELTYAKKKSPTKHLIQTEACIDSEVPKWKDDNWYWSGEAKDWGYDWAKQEDKYLHPKYVPVFRYANDIIGCLNNYVDGWIDWNMVLNRQGGPNWFKNWCAAPILVDENADEVYITPLYYVMAHFSKFVRPGARRIGYSATDSTLKITAAKNIDGNIVLIIFNPSDQKKIVKTILNGSNKYLKISEKALQTIVFKKD